MFYSHLKETEYRLNHQHDHLSLDLLKLPRVYPLSFPKPENNSKAILNTQSHFLQALACDLPAY